MEWQYIYGVLITARGKELMVRLGSAHEQEGYEQTESLAKLGLDGWEMCGTFINNDEIYMFFKRQRLYPVGGAPMDMPTRP